MGNCIETFKHTPETETCRIGEEEEEEEKAEMANGTTERKGENMKIKIVLTKEELEWLMFQLENRDGKGLADVLGEIQRSRAKAVASASSWKPSLDSILEIPEVPETMEK